MTDDVYKSEHDGSDDSRRTFAKKGALAASALALGAGASSTAAAQDNGEALVFPHHYIPEQDLDVLSQFEQGNTVNVLELDGETVPEISQPDEYNGYVVRYDIGEETAGATGFLFLRNESLDDGDTVTLSADATMFSSELNILSVSINGG
ncbi:calcium-binding protein [Natribaculum luteum]|uniref:Calcium-binding protein n=1 Tax=Natribaculum luteum TaxID=1586232 RepID=A0ABD5P5K6_9EURY|nr:calcium-binding protein [Natribaculum luteum]